MRIPVVAVGLWFDSKWTPDRKHGMMHSFQSIEQADEFLKVQPEPKHWIFQVNWKDGTEQKGRLFENIRLVSQWLKTWAERTITGPVELPAKDRKDFVKWMLDTQPKLVEHAHKLLNQLQIE